MQLISVNVVYLSNPTKIPRIHSASSIHQEIIGDISPRNGWIGAAFAMLFSAPSWSWRLSACPVHGVDATALEALHSAFLHLGLWMFAG